MKRAGVFLILFSMILHCGIRLGFGTWIYQNRQSLAFSVGLVEEAPITMCSHEHDADRAVKIEVSEDTQDKQLPSHTFQVREINLFFEHNIAQCNPEMILLREHQLPAFLEKDYPPPVFPIVHPPA